ncbi:MAG: cobalamin-dependent protein, partial [Patescibacteria group bacterium]
MDDKLPEYFYQRFDEGRIKNSFWPRITSDETIKLFPERGLHILFINVPIREWAYPNVMPIGQGYVGAVARMDGHIINVLDLNAERKEPIKDALELYIKQVEARVIQKLEEAKPDVIGIGGIITQYAWIKRIVSICKVVYPDVSIVLGGGIATCAPEFMIKHLPIDVVIQQEGEITFSEVLHRIELKKKSFEAIKGVVWRENISSGYAIRNNGFRPSIKAYQDGLDLVPWPLRSAWPEEEVYRINPKGHLNWKNKWLTGAPTEKNQYSSTMIASRGCPYAIKGCDYCYAMYLGKLYRLRSPKEVADEMQYLQQRFGVVYIHFLDDLLLVNYQWALEFFRELRKKRESGFDVIWGGSCRTNIVADDVLRARKEGRPHILEQAYEVGMRQAGYGIESASPIILKNIDKSGQTVEKMKIAIKETQRVMGYVDCSFMIGSPGETEATVKETVDFC